jgi:hypothetical protein
MIDDMTGLPTPGGINHPHHPHSHSSHPFLMSSVVESSQGPQMSVLPQTPPNTILTLSALDGKFAPQYYVPNEAADLLSLSELNDFAAEVNSVLTATTPSQTILVIWTLLLIIGCAIGFNFLFSDPVLNPPFSDPFAIFVSCGIGSGFGFMFSLLPTGLYTCYQMSRRTQQLQSLLERLNQQTFVRRDCHW